MNSKIKNEEMEMGIRRNIAYNLFVGMCISLTYSRCVYLFVLLFKCDEFMCNISGIIYK